LKSGLKKGGMSHKIHLFDYIESPDFLSFSTDQFGHKIMRTKIVHLASSLLHRLFFEEANNENDFDVDIEIETETEFMVYI
jgi:hypothetical protein